MKTRMYQPINHTKGLMEALEIKRVRDFTFSNTSDSEEEIQRYKKIADYFAKKGSRDRYNTFNQAYLNQVHERLLAIRGETTPEHISGLCSKLLKRFEAGIV